MLRDFPLGFRIEHLRIVVQSLRFRYDSIGVILVNLRGQSWCM